MKTFFVFLISLSMTSISAQTFLEAYEANRHLEPYDNLNGTYSYETLTGNSAEWSKVMGVGYDFDNIRFKKLGLKGSAYLFDTWESSAMVEVDKKRYIFPRINYHIYRGEFMSKLENDSIFVLNFDAIDRIKVGNRTFRSVYNSTEGTSKAYEVIFENKEFAILKGYVIKFVASSPNPMVNRPEPKIKKSSSYYTLKNGDIQPMKLKKATVLNLMGDRADKAQEYASMHKLSFKKDRDITKILNYASLN